MVDVASDEFIIDYRGTIAIQEPMNGSLADIVEPKPNLDYRAMVLTKN